MQEKIKQIVRYAKANESIVWVYPYGRNGKEIIGKFNQLGFKNVKKVDDFEPGDDIFKFDKMIKDISSKDVVFISSEHDEIISNIFREVENKRIDIRNVFEAYGEYPFTIFTDLRIRHLLYCAEEIYRNNVEGSVAEAGVYKGEFAKHINAFFPSRNCFLFDSFEGFSQDDANCEKDNEYEYSEWVNTLKDTSVSLVMDKMIAPDRVIIKKGFVPDTFENITGKFAFVNLDMDLYEPTVAALEFFWPRLSKGGYIFIHDYLLWGGIEVAVKEFCNKYEVGYIRLGDGVTVAIHK